MTGFTAWCQCPECGQLGCHGLREPAPAPSPEELEKWRNRRTTVDIKQWGAGVVRTVDTSPPPPMDESQFEVIRTCTGCSHEWGQT